MQNRFGEETEKENEEEEEMSRLVLQPYCVFYHMAAGNMLSVHANQLYHKIVFHSRSGMHIPSKLVMYFDTIC